MAKKVKILLAVLLVLAFVIGAACSAEEEIRQPAAVTGDPGTVTETAAHKEEESGTEEPAESQPEAPAAITVAETVLYEADGIKVTATGYEESFMGPAVTLLIENNSDGNALVTADAVSVNGYMMPYASLYADVAAGKKANESLSLMNAGLEQAGIETVAELQFYLKITDADTWEEKAVSELLAVQTSAAGFAQPVDDTGDVLYDDNGIRVICKGLKQDIVWDGTIVFYMENNSGAPITVYAENVSVNGFMEDAGLWSNLRDGTRIIDGMSLLDLSDLELESIDDVENIEFTLRIINAENWNEIAATDVITLRFG